MRTRSSSNLPGESSPNPTSSNQKHCNRRRSKQPFILEESPVGTMADQRTMVELLRAPTKGYVEAIVVLPILAEQFELKHSLINMMTSDYNAKSSSSSEIAKLTHTVNQQTSVVTTAMTAILKQFQATPPLASVKAVEEIYVTCGGAHPYYQCLVADGNTFLELRDNIQGFVSAAAVNYNQVVPLSELEKIKKMNEISMKAMKTQINNVKNELRNEMKTSIQASMSNQTNKLKNMMASFFQMNTASTSGSGPLPSNTEDEHVEETLTDPELDALILISKYQKMLKALISNKEKLLELANIPLNENYSAVILKKLPEKLRDPRKFLIPCSFSELKCKALADIGASINLMPLSVWKKLGLPELISTRMTLELTNRAICTPAGIARDVFVPVEKFTFPADFVIVDYESNPRVPLILGKPFLRTAHALIDVHGEEMILHDGDEILTLNMRHDNSSYSNQLEKESINMINIYNDSYEDFLKDLFATNHLSGNPTCSSHTNLTSPEVKDDIFDPERDMVLIEKLINLNSTKDLPPPHNINPLSGSTTSSSSPDHLLEEFIDKLALIKFPPRNDDLPFDIEFDLKEIEFLLNHDPIKDMDSILEDSVDNLVDLNDKLVDTMPEMFTNEHALDYSPPSLYDEYDDDLFEVEFDTEYVYDDPFDSKEDGIKESKLLIEELYPLRSSYLLPSPEYDSFLFKDFSEVDALPSTNNEDKVFNSGILIQENLFEVTTHVAPDKNVKKIAISYASLILEDFDPPLSDYELPFHKEVPGSETLLSFSFENEEKVFKPRILTSKGVHSSLLLKISHRGPKAFKVIKILQSPMKIFSCSFGEDIRILDVPYLHFYPP
uniref:Reverse transcriptase domain-containing protein n=1 Tax=Tanacetum cinerariifolium TaxID=118510 RepID=A0A6L2K467_TANCI|nr:reverse transcriptase domain-containing protein [Tanacetum cinerariifolium]